MVTNHTPISNPVIIGADINASLGTRGQRETDTMEKVNILGLLGNPRKNDRGEMILNMLRQTDFHTALTYFESNNGHDT